jgi:hypothetical protein
MKDKEIGILRELAKKYIEICDERKLLKKRDMWRRHNSFRKTPILIYVRAFAWNEMPESKCRCQNGALRHYENFFREAIFRATFKDDFIFEPWINVGAAYKCSGWGINAERHFADEKNESLTAFKVEYPLKDLSDFGKMRAPWHEIDEAGTAESKRIIEDAVGDIITVNVDRSPAYRMWSGDISTDLGYLRGIETIMIDMFDNPEWLHRLLAFMRDGILKTHEQAEKAGDWGLCAHQNQAMSYSEELQDPAANVNGVKRSQLWGYMAAQEYTLISPEMHDEFLLQYQLPILEKFGLAAYGCCEDLSRKIDLLRKIPNLRRIAVSPFANVAKCAEQIGSDYVVSYRPSPSDMVSYGFDPDRIKKIISGDLGIFKRNGSCFDITLKDVETVQNDPNRIRRWVEIVRGITEKF